MNSSIHLWHTKVQTGKIFPKVNKDTFILGATNCCLIELKNNLSTVNPAVEPIGEPTSATVLNQYNFSMHSKYLSLHTQINIVLTHQ